MFSDSSRREVCLLAHEAACIKAFLNLGEIKTETRIKILREHLT